jgi:cytochrome P450 PksS
MGVANLKDLARKDGLSDLGILSLRKKVDQERFARELRRRGDVFWNPIGKFWVVSRYKLAAECMRSSAFKADRRGFFVQRMPEVDPGNLKNFFPIVSDMMVMQDGSGHKLRRKIAANAISSFSREQLMKLMDQSIDRLLVRVLRENQRSSEIDFVSAVANVLPAAILAEMFGIEQHDQKSLFEFSNTMTVFFGGAAEYNNEVALEVDRCALQMKKFFQKLVQKRRKASGDDLLSKMVLSAAELGLSDEVLVSQAIMMFVAGVVTTNDQIAHNLILLLENTSPQQRQKADLRGWVSLVDECTRLDPAVTFTFRSVDESTTIGSQEIKARETVFFAHHAINRDEDVFVGPHVFDGGRKQNRHAGFGLGAHRCVGAGPANIQMAMLFQKLFSLASDAKLGRVERDHYSLSFSGCKSVGLHLGPVGSVSI